MADGGNTTNLSDLVDFGEGEDSLAKALARAAAGDVTSAIPATGFGSDEGAIRSELNVAPVPRTPTTRAPVAAVGSSLQQSRNRTTNRFADVRQQFANSQELRSQANVQTRQAAQAKVAADLAEQEAREGAAAQTAGAVVEANNSLRQINTEREEALQSKLTAIDSARREYNESKAVDPNRLLSSTGNKIIAALATALGAFGSSLTGGQNTGLTVVNQAIQRDIDEQLEARADKKEALNAAKDAFDVAESFFSDKQSQELFAKNLLLEDTKAATSKMLEGARSQQVVANGQATMAQIDQEIANNESKLVELQGQLASQESQADFRTAAALDEARMAQLGAQAAAAQGAAKLSKETRGVLASVETGVQKLNRLEQSLAETSSNGAANFIEAAFPGTSVQEFNAVKDNIVKGMVRSIDPASRTDADFEQVARLFPGALDTQRVAAAKMRELRQFLFDNAQVALRAEQMGGVGIGLSPEQFAGAGDTGFREAE